MTEEQIIEEQLDFERALDTAVDDLARDIAQHNAHDRTR